MRYDSLLKAVDDVPLSRTLSKTLQAARRGGDKELEAWTRLELLGYWNSNPALTEQTVVPEYRTVPGEWMDEYGRRLLLTQPDLQFINETRIRWGVAELETLAEGDAPIVFRLPGPAEIIREHLGVTVSIFRFSPASIPGVLWAIKAHLVQLLTDTSRSSGQPQPPSPAESGAQKAADVLVLRPSLYGIGVDLRALWRRVQAFRRKD